MDILSKIVDYKQSVISSVKKALPVSSMDLQKQTRGFSAGIASKHKQRKTAIIAEIKKHSPSRGILCTDFDVTKIAREYEQGGATCISVLTDERFFHGHNDDIRLAKESSSLPILRKDFIIDEYQIYESKHISADAILLMASILDGRQMADFESLAFELGLSVLLEVHNAREMESALKNTKTPLVGINNRNLHNLSIDLQNTIDLIKLIPSSRIGICESGIESRSDIDLIKSHDCNCFLIGTSIMQQSDKVEFIKTLIE